jgi:hypothetical protein
MTHKIVLFKTKYSKLNIVAFNEALLLIRFINSMQTLI